MHDTNLIAGESVEILFEAFRRLEVKQGPDGMIACAIELEAELGQPLLRAVHRVEQELRSAELALIESDESARRRTEDQRLADAFVELALAVSAAVFNRAA